MQAQTSVIPQADRITFFADGLAVTTVFGSRLPGSQRISDHIEANDYESAVQVKQFGRAIYANHYGPSGRRIVLAPATKAPKRKRQMREETKWKRLNGPVTITRSTPVV